ncbi:hypothetical protein DIU31_009445 [Mucilaginibacter rubeus]|uniref:Uncharacterized protein n=1 Tax=Mucilaginibacter rubeus TaxID=2027860 RepID=A0AAE6MHK8_9SPHI|nr:MULTISPECIES: hypothetical protein [Mucilaginibacter]QEM03725.1 hypothetical protein DIU31_009445 [Mucilaginibacter rubeus]QEM16336.1 hypothetical protein DIU38_009540 [Mucilaginibacter gossypii]QTE40898.1 hypothetical protein J3L19_18220 [Mucilaginibacter rubeus]QTE47501.1 hypothetical protein J3L21_18195 [Mucilaginibacter rubeus]QTE58893.1 hypothetical protein J3L23_09860 [Mucilaginibacter rubeus]
MHCKGKTILIAFLTLLGTSFALIGLTNRLVLTPEFYKNSGDLLGYDDNAIATYVNAQNWIYLFEGLYLTIKLTLIALVIYTTFYVAKYQIRFRSIFGVVVYAEFVFLFAAFGKLLWFHYFEPAGTLSDWHKTYLLSTLSLFPNVPVAWYYPLQSLNAFEIAYWFALAFGLTKITTLNFDNSLLIVLKGYVPALVVWIACVVFTTMVVFPAQA